MLPASISEHHCPSNTDNLSLVDTVIETQICRFHHKLRPSVFTTAVSVPIVGTILAPVLAPLQCRTLGTVQTVAWQLGHVIAKRSVDSVMSDFSGTHLGRPGLGDKMFSNAAADHEPLTSISASPPENTIRPHVGNRSSFDFDSILDDEQISSQEDSLFEKTHCRLTLCSVMTIHFKVVVCFLPINYSGLFQFTISEAFISQ